MREVVLDLEHTGYGHARGGRIVELAAIELQAGAPTGRTFHSRFNPGPASWNNYAIGVHGIEAAAVAQEPAFSDRALELAALLDEALVIAHNASSDLAYLRPQLADLGLEIPWADTLCTYKLARRMWPGAGAWGLEAIAGMLGTGVHGSSHSAMGDAQTLAHVWQVMRPEAAAYLPHLRLGGVSASRLRMG